MRNTIKPRIIAQAATVVLAALLAACSSSNTTSEDLSSSIVGTRWDGPDDFGDQYQMYFDEEAALRSYAVDYDVWVNEDSTYELAWSQEGDVVTIYSTDVTADTTVELTGTIDGDHLRLEGTDGEYIWWLDLTRVD